uniref:Putative non-structural protein n=1 Tax=Picornavirales N_OV_080 TaxID=2016022 RepID=A0A218NJS2_9VIRU|nr:putative non-structural protein [Picornavirales N_OV_080]
MNKVIFNQFSDEPAILTQRTAIIRRNPGVINPINKTWSKSSYRFSYLKSILFFSVLFLACGLAADIPNEYQAALLARKNLRKNRKPVVPIDDFTEIESNPLLESVPNEVKCEPQYKEVPYSAYRSYKPVPQEIATISGVILGTVLLIFVKYFMKRYSKLIPTEILAIDLLNPQGLTTEILLPQSLTSSIIDTFYSKPFTPDLSAITNVLESVFLYAFSCSRCSDYTEMISVTALFLKSLFKGPVYQLIFKHVKAFWDSIDSLLQSQGSKFSSVTVFLRSILTDYTKIVYSELANKFTAMLSTIIACGVLEISSIPAVFSDITNVISDNINKSAKSVKTSTFHLVYVVADTAVFCLERIESFRTSGNVNSLINSEDQLNELPTLVNIFHAMHAEIYEGDVSRYANFIDVRGRISHIFDRTITNKAIPGNVRLQLQAQKIAIDNKYNKTRAYIAAAKELPEGIGFALVGPPRTGKSVLTKDIHSVVSTVIDIPLTDLNTCSLQTHNGFHSARPGVVFGKIDDMGIQNVPNKFPEEVETVIRAINSEPAFATKADIEDKDMVLLNVMCLVVTSNSSTLGANNCVNDRGALFRRLIRIEVTIKDEFADTGGYAIKRGVPLGSDVALFTISVNKTYMDKGELVSNYVPAYNDEGLLLNLVSKATMLNYVHSTATQHFALQNSKFSKKEPERCAHGVNKLERCTICLPDDDILTSQGLVETVQRLAPLCLRFMAPDFFPKFVEFATALQHTHYILDYVIIGLICLMPLDLYLDIDLLPHHGSMLFLCVAVRYAIRYVYNSIFDYVNEQLVLVGNAEAFANDIKKNFYSCTSDVIISAVAIIGAWKAISSTYNWYQLHGRRFYGLEKQGNIMTMKSATPSHIEKVNVYNKTPKIEPLPTSASNRSTSRFQLTSKLQRSQRRLVIAAGLKYDCAIIPLANTMWVTTSHTVPPNGGDFVIEQVIDEEWHAITKGNICEEDIYRLPDKDLAFIRLDVLGPNQDFIKHIAKTHLNLPDKGVLLSNTREFALAQERVTMEPKIKSVLQPNGAVKEYDGYAYNLKPGSMPGMCGSPLITSNNVITGVHIAGKAMSCFAIPITVGMCMEAHDHLFETPLLSQGGFMTTCDSLLGELTDVHPKSATWFLPPSRHPIYGDIRSLKSTFNSCVKDRSTKPIVQERMGNMGDYGMPKGRGYWVWWNDLNTLSTDVVVPSKFLRRATIDYKKRIDPFIEDFKEHIHPYSLENVLNGEADVAFVDSLNYSTAMGLPYKGQKKDAFELRSDGKRECPDFLKDEMNEFIENARNGEYTIGLGKAVIKDEAIPLEKEKARIFIVCPIVLLLLGRMYTLSILRFFSLYSVRVESAVGINATSLEWRQLYSHITRFGSGRMIAGDFKSFDKIFSPALCMKIIDVIVHIARMGEYDDDDIRVLVAVIYSTFFAPVSWNSTIIIFQGYNTSGNFGTVMFNNIANSILCRSMYFSIYDSLSITVTWMYHERVVQVNYGDDNVLGVHEDEKIFHHTSLQAAFAKCSITYTMADKEAASEELIDISRVDFLKRTFRLEGEYIFAPLAEKSIYKMLTVGIPSKFISEETQLCQVMQSALWEAFQHGEAYYDFIRCLVSEIIEIQDLAPIMGTILSYKEMYDRVIPNYTITSRVTDLEVRKNVHLKLKNLLLD